MDRRRISTDRVPAALGPYSQAIVAGGFVFGSGTSGSTPTPERTRRIEAQTEQALISLARDLGAGRVFGGQPRENHDPLAISEVHVNRSGLAVDETPYRFTSESRIAAC